MSKSGNKSVFVTLFYKTVVLTVENDVAQLPTIPIFFTPLLLPEKVISNSKYVTDLVNVQDEVLKEAVESFSDLAKTQKK